MSIKSSNFSPPLPQQTQMIAANEAVYAAYGGVSEPVLALCSMATVYSTVALVGVVFNMSLVWCTYKERALRSTTNIFLALTSVFESLHQSFGHFTFFVVAISGINFIPFQTAFWIQWPSIFGLSGAQMLMVSTAFDRLFCVFSPLNYHRINPRWQVTANTLIAMITGFASVYCAHSLQPPEMLVTGSLVDIYSSQYGLIMQVYMMTTCLVSALLYCAIWARIRLQHFNAHQQQQAGFEQKIFKCLCCIIVVVLGGYIISAAVSMSVIVLVQPPGLLNYFLESSVTVLLNIGAAAGAPILYTFSNDYQKAFRRHLIDPALRMLTRRNSKQTATKQAKAQFGHATLAHHKSVQAQKSLSIVVQNNARLNTVGSVNGVDVFVRQCSVSSGDGGGVNAGAQTNTMRTN